MRFTTNVRGVFEKGNRNNIRTSLRGIKEKRLLFILFMNTIVLLGMQAQPSGRRQRGPRKGRYTIV